MRQRWPAYRRPPRLTRRERQSLERFGTGELFRSTVPKADRLIARGLVVERGERLAVTLRGRLALERR